ncbi:HK97-gp10 family putative phage morphogenesis protein [Xanthobacter sp. DSM 24535]|uniref:HK97-gp10 family putative phage morphogenesis protein n=1 Tax=Roseixanthobacter psychrophilus TaxID=3119917 RepID=UPI003728D34B
MARSNQLTRVNRMLDGATKAAIAEVQPALLKAGDRISDTMHQLAERSRDTGNLIESITVTPGGKRTPSYSQPGGETVVPKNAVMITAGDSDARYPHLVEYGTKTAHAQPFFWPAFRLERKKAAASIKRAISKAVRKGAKNGV